MLKRILITLTIGAGVGLAGHAWRSDSLAGDPASNIADNPQQQGTALAEASEASQAPSCSDEAAPQERAASADACLLDAALATTEPVRTEALRRAARLLRSEDGTTADLVLMLAAARGSVDALADYGSAVLPDDSTGESALLRREAALMAAQGGSREAQASLDRLRAPFYGQAVSRPEILISLLEGRGLDLADNLETRRFVLGIASGYQSSCPFSTASWDGASFSRARDMYASPVTAIAHTQIASSATTALSNAADAVGRFAKLLDHGASYAESGAGLLRELQDAQRTYNNAVAKVSEAGARDGVRIAELLGGCSSVEGTRFTRALMAVFIARARQTPAPG